jgi:hypothetical protein
LLILEAD